MLITSLLTSIFSNQADDHHHPMYEYILDHVTTSGPTCEDLGIPRDDACALSPSPELIQKPIISTDFSRLQTLIKEDKDPFSQRCMIPLPSPFGMSIFDSPCFRRRNERERDRVRCVNDGYLKLKQHLPIENKDKRLSKVDTLRCAIKYIKYLENLLNNSSTTKRVPKRDKVVNVKDHVHDNVGHLNADIEFKIEADFSEDDLDLTTDTSDYESKCDASSEPDTSE